MQGPVVVELEDDMMTIKHRPKHIFPITYKGTSFEDHQFFEASSIRKIGEKYYFVYSTFNQHELAYATSDYPDRDFRFGGVIISNGDIGYNGRKPEDRLNMTGNNHGSIECINGKWYIFYHRQTHQNEYSRQACAEQIELLPNGFIPQVQVTSCGLNGKPLVAKGEYPSPICCNLTNGKMTHGRFEGKHLPHITHCGEEQFISMIAQDTMIGYKYFDFNGKSKFGIEYRGMGDGTSGDLLIRCATDGEVIGKIPVTDKKNWEKAEGVFEFPCGKHPLYLFYEGDGSIELKGFYFE